MIKFDKNELAQRVSKSLKPMLDQTISYNILCLNKACESPIEVALGAAILVADQLDHPNMRNGLILSGVNEVDFFREDLALLIPQFPFDGYRIDFALRLPKYRFQYLLVECDGHDFHERTKEQAARYRAKDRYAQHMGMPILRFTGSEIHKDAGACAFQVLDFIAERHEDFKPGGW
jgi:very-short-patch-repair endonuclease